MSGEKQAYTRFSVVQRIEHVVMFTSFIVLAVTGLPQKFVEAGISQAIINLFGGIEMTRQIHHVAAIVLLLSSAFHLIAVGYRLFVMRSRPSMLPGLKDVRDGINDFGYNFGLRKALSQGGRFTWMEKMEYWALVWGTLVMALTGFFMWNPIATTEILPGEAIPAAKMAHGWEAVLAVMAVIIWHFYSVHLKRFNKSMFTGKMDEHHMLEEHPLELADLKAGLVPRPRDPKYSKRQAIYVPLASAIGAVLVVTIFRFMTFEKTAIDTIPQRFQEKVQVYSPLAPTPFPTQPPTPTAVAVAKADWATVGAILEKECATCHNGSVAGLDFTTYAGAMKGGKSGAVIKPGDPASLIVQKVAGGTHPGHLSPAELEALKTWIANGASETGEGAAVSAPAAGGGWASGIDQLIVAKCASCHVDATQGGLSLKTYADALKGGKSGPAIVSGDPANSLLVKIQQKGGHPGQFSPDELTLISAWIKAGAPGATVPAATPAASVSSAAQWSDVQAILTAKCGSCHVSAATADVSFASYANAAKNFTPGDPDNSLLVQVQKAGGHPGQLSPDEIATIAAWIKAGAPEQGGGATAPAASGTGGAVAQWSDAQAILTAKCGGCHVSAATADVSFASYADAVKNFTPGDPDNSLLVQVQKAGGHPGQLSPDEITALAAWIKAGAPEKSSGAAVPTPSAAVAVAQWSDAQAVLTAKCGGCHVNTTTADVSFASYAAAIKNLTPGDPDKSLLLQVQKAGGHPGQLSPDEIAAFTAWIKAGAPEKSSGAPASTPAATPATSSAVTQWREAQAILVGKCAACHINTTTAGVSFVSYADAAKHFTPGDPDKSVLLQVQQAGGHPGQLSTDEIAALAAWIKAGAPEKSDGTVPPAAGAPAEWATFETTLNTKCGSCHVKTQMGGLSVKTYADVLKGGKTGPAVVPGDPDKSVLVKVQKAGNHANVLSAEELAALIAWIKAGAPEKVSGAAVPATSTSANWATFETTLNTKCGSCHVKAQLGGLSVKTYADVLKGGKTGPAVVPSQPDQSVLVKVQQAGKHANVLSAEELAALIAWIKAGAPEK